MAKVSDAVLAGLVATLNDFLPEDRVMTNRETLVHYSYDATELHFVPQVALLPVSTEEVARIMRLAYERGVPVTPQGGRTGLSGGALPVEGGLVLSFLRMNHILEIDRKNMQIVVEPGVIAADLQLELARHDLFFPPDPSSTVESTLGGNVAENAGYTRAVKYGVTRDYVLGLEAVLPNGDIVNVGGRTVKDVTGYDLVSLLVGSEGTLALVTKIICRVLPRPRFRRTVLFRLGDLVSAAELAGAIFGGGIIPCAIELIDDYCLAALAEYLPGAMAETGLVLGPAEAAATGRPPGQAAAVVLVEVDGNHEPAVEAEAREILQSGSTTAGVLEARLARTDADAERLWRIRRETLPALKAKGKDHLEADVVVPRYQLPFLAQAVKQVAAGKKVQVATFGHAGDGNLHVTIQYRKGNFAQLAEANELLGELYRITVEMGGKLTGEHGVGLTAKEYLGLQMSPAEIALMRRIKAAFDPRGLLNPGKIFPENDAADPAA